MDGELPNALGAFLKESITLLGYQPLGITAAITLVITAAAMWCAAKLLERKERHAGSALASGFMVVLIAAFLGAAYLVLLLKGYLEGGTQPNPTLFFACAGIAVLLLCILTHGAFGMPAWKTPFLLIVLSGAVAASGYAAQHWIIGSQLERIPVLAAQVAGLKTQEPSMIQSEELKKIATARGVQAEREELKQRQSALVTTYQKLLQDRAKLNSTDAVAVEAFNQRAEEYQKEKQYVTSRIAAIDAATPVPAPEEEEE